MTSGFTTWMVGMRAETEETSVNPNGLLLLEEDAQGGGLFPQKIFREQ
jgi:hypothetical protein